MEALNFTALAPAPGAPLDPPYLCKTPLICSHSKESPPSEFRGAPRPQVSEFPFWGFVERMLLPGTVRVAAAWPDGDEISGGCLRTSRQVKDWERRTGGTAEDALVVIFLLYLTRAPPKSLPDVSSSQLAFCVAVSFSTGALLSACAALFALCSACSACPSLRSTTW